jgi:hypothetical protein
MITPQLTEQYGHVERVSVVRAIFNSFACAKTGRASNPSSSAAAPPVPTLKNSRLDKPMAMSLLLGQVSTNPSLYENAFCTA